MVLPPLGFSAVWLLISRNILKQNLSHQIHSHSPFSPFPVSGTLISTQHCDSLVEPFNNSRSSQCTLFTFSPQAFVCMWTCHGAHMEVRSQLAGLSVLLSPCEFWVLNSGCQALEQSSCYWVFLSLSPHLLLPLLLFHVNCVRHLRHGLTLPAGLVWNWWQHLYFSPRIVNTLFSLSHCETSYLSTIRNLKMKSIVVDCVFKQIQVHRIVALSIVWGLPLYKSHSMLVPAFKYTIVAPLHKVGCHWSPLFGLPSPPREINKVLLI